ncbi:hypothetical protein J1C73_28400 [Streptomyces laculatispora]|nr:hypothetical protein [Streptomyces laculatispora]
MNGEWTTGQCWRCDEPDVPVLWIGPVQSLEHGEAPLHCRLPCIRRLEAFIRGYNSQGPYLA